MDLKLSQLRLQLAVHFDVPKSWMMYMPRCIAPFPRYMTLLPERGVSVILYSGGRPDSQRLERFETQSGYPLLTLPEDGARTMFEFVDKMRIEEARKQKAIALRNAAKAKHDGDSWLADILEAYERIMAEGGCHMRAAKYDLACATYGEAAAALNWKEEDSDGEGGGEGGVDEADEDDDAAGGAAAAGVAVSPSSFRAKLQAKRALSGS
jgi:hypothetical protein